MPVRIESSFISGFVKTKSLSVIIVYCDGVVLGISIPYLASVELKPYFKSKNFNSYPKNDKGKNITA